MDKKEITKEEILAAIVSRFFDDYEFIETINNITYSRKAQLKASGHTLNIPQKHDGNN